VSSTLVRSALALSVTLLLAPLVLALLRRRQVLDHPSERSSHESPVPRGGGLAPAVGALIALAVMPALTLRERAAMGATAALFGVVGLLEDVVGIRALHRLGIQFLCAGTAGWFLLDRMTGPALWRALFCAGVVFWVAAFVNAYNFMDGIDGISVAQAVGAGVTWLAVGALGDAHVLAAGGAIVAGAALGFAPFNLPKARMFLGDVGSYFIGAWLAAVAVLGLRAGVAPEAVLAPLALYIADTGVTLVRRVARGERWYEPHRDHAYQRLGNLGWSHVRRSALVAACIGVCGLLGAVSLGGAFLARVAADAAILGVVTAYLLAPRLLTRSTSDVAIA
jgi:UDP-GlcNAc:undecaprenyl-phosphate GlcNAc-1-phosphate transferase